MTQETKLTEPVQVGLWYETKAGAIVKIDYEEKGETNPFEANNGLNYSESGHLFSSLHPNNADLIRCLGADPFKQVDISKTETTTPTQFERIFTAILSGTMSNRGCMTDDFINGHVAETIKITQEAIKQLDSLNEPTRETSSRSLKEIEGA